MDSSNNCNNNNQSETKNIPNKNESLLNTSDEIIKQDFFFIPDPSDQFESSRQFKKTIGDSDQVSEDFEWLNSNIDYTDRNLKWHSTPVPKNTKIIPTINDESKNDGIFSSTSSSNSSYDDKTYNEMDNE